MAFKSKDGIPKTDKIWVNGEFVNWDDAKIHICSHVIHYGTSFFEGIRCYETPKGSAIFRLKEHTERLFNSCKMYRMEIPFSQDEFNKAIFETIKINKLTECYIRPIVFRGFGSLGVNPFPCPIDAVIVVWEWGKYLGPEALENGVDVKIASWNRIAPNTLPAMSKCGANYMNSQLIKMEAITDDYAEGIALDTTGYVSEGSGENLFLISEGILYTPPLGSSILPGITRDSVIKLAGDRGYQVVETQIAREALYIADELFFTGTAAEITPIRSVDKIEVGSGKRGEITKKLQDDFFAIINSEKEDKYGWLHYVE